MGDQSKQCPVCLTYFMSTRQRDHHVANAARLLLAKTALEEAAALVKDNVAIAAAAKVPKLDKARRRDASRARARYAPRGGASDSRPEAVREDSGANRRLLKLLRTRRQFKLNVG